MLANIGCTFPFVCAALKMANFVKNYYTCSISSKKFPFHVTMAVLI